MPTMYKNNSRNSSKFKGCSPLQLSCNLTGMKPAFAYIFIAKPLACINSDSALPLSFFIYHPTRFLLNILEWD